MVAEGHVDVLAATVAARVAQRFLGNSVQPDLHVGRQGWCRLDPGRDVGDACRGRVVGELGDQSVEAQLVERLRLKLEQQRAQLRERRQHQRSDAQGRVGDGARVVVGEMHERIGQERHRVHALGDGVMEIHGDPSAFVFDRGGGHPADQLESVEQA